MKRLSFLLSCLFAMMPVFATSIFYINHTQQLTLQFPSEIKYVDVGSRHVKLSKLSDNCTLSIRAKHAGISPTTLSVATADANYYLYNLVEAPTLPYLAYHVQKGPLPAAVVQIASEQTTHFIAPFMISDWSVGSDSVLAAYADGIRNMVRVKATDVSKRESSITLLGSQGRLSRIGWCMPIVCRNCRYRYPIRHRLRLSSKPIPWMLNCCKSWQIRPC